MKTISRISLSAAGLFASVTVGSAAIIMDDFDSDTSANYTEVGGADGTVTFAYDYSADAIPAAPNSAGSTLGLRMTANDSVGASDAVTLFNTTAATGSYRLSVDVYMGVTGTGGTTEFMHVGVAGDGSTINTIFSPVAGSGHFLAVTGEGGSSSDFRHTTPSTLAVPSGDLTYLNDLNTTNATGDTYQAIFAGGDFPGSPGNRWTTLTIDVVAGGNVTYAFDGTPIIQTPNEEAHANRGDFVSLGYADLFSSIASPVGSMFVVYDNLSVEAIPEPSSGVLALLGGLVALRRRR